MRLFTGRTVFLFKSNTVDDVGALVSPSPALLQFKSPCPGSGEGDDASNVVEVGLRIFRFQGRGALGSGQATEGQPVVSQVAPQDVHLQEPLSKEVQEPENSVGGQPADIQKTHEWHEVGDDLEWIVPSSAQSLTSYSSEDSPEPTLQDLSHHRCIMGQDLELCSSGIPEQ